VISSFSSRDSITDPPELPLSNIRAAPPLRQVRCGVPHPIEFSLSSGRKRKITQAYRR
jgi:hypothetical protein